MEKNAVILEDANENTSSAGCLVYLGTVSLMRLEFLNLNVIENALT